MAINIRADFIDVVHAARTGDPVPEIFLCASFGKEGSDGATLARLRKELKLDQYRCTTLLRSEDYQMHQVDALNVPAAEMKAAMRWRVKDILDYPIDAATVEVLDIPVDPNGPARAHSMYAITARNSVIESRIKPFTEAQVPLEVIDIPDLAQRNLAALLEPAGRGIVLLAFYENKGILTYTSGGELYLTRPIEIALSQLAEADAQQRTQHFERIALEVQRSLDHLDSQYHYVPIAKVLLAPMVPDLGLQQYLSANLYVPVETLDLASVMDFSAVQELNEPVQRAQCLATIGAALRVEEALA